MLRRPAARRYIGLGGTTATGSSAYQTFDYANVDIKPETGEYFDVGFLFSAGGFAANVDYYAITIQDYTRTMTTANVLDAIAMEVPGGGSAAPTACW